MNTATVTFNNGIAKVRVGRKTELEVEVEDMDGTLDLILEQNGYPRMSPWTQVGKFHKATVQLKGE